MQDKLQALEDKYLDLEAKISDPDVIANQAEWQKYARRQRQGTCGNGAGGTERT